IRAGSTAWSDAPKSWVFEGSNDNNTWTTIHTVTSQTGWSDFERRSYADFTNPTNYRYYRWTSMGGQNSAVNWVRLSEIEVFESLTFNSTINSLTLGNTSGTTTPTLLF